MSDTTKGILAIIGATMVWGLSPLYYKLLAAVPPLEVLSHRTLWSLVFFGTILTLQGRLPLLRSLLMRPKDAMLVTLAAVMISTNWFLFILSIQIEHAVEASLGYYIFPLVAVLFGMVFFGERPTAFKALAVGLAGVAVATLTWGLGVAPWISLALAFTFGLYGVVKKHLDAGPVVSVSAEVAVLAPLALIWLIGVHQFGWTGVVGRNMGAFGHDLRLSLLLAFSGILTATPLILFSSAARRLPMGTVGVMQYINPSLQFLVATVIFGESITRWHWIAFPLIWVAVVIYSVETLRQDRAARRRAIMASTSGTTAI